MNPYSATFPKKLSYLCLLVAFCFGAFLFDPTNRPLKYTLLGIAFLSTISSLTQQGFSSSFKSYSQFIFPWLPWFFCVFVVIAVHGGENFYFDSFLILSLLFFSLRDITIKRNWVNCAIAVTGALVSFAVIWEVINLKHLPAEIYQVNKNVLMSGVSLLMTCSITSLLFDFRHNRIAINILLAISITASLICIVLTEVRTALLAILALIPLTFFYNKQNPWKYIFILFSISLVMLALFWYTGRLQEGIADLEKFQSGNSNSSWGIRLELWKLSLDAFFSKPVFGWGVQPFKEIIQPFVVCLYLYVKLKGFEHFHAMGNFIVDFEQRFHFAPAVDKFVAILLAQQCVACTVCIGYATCEQWQVVVAQCYHAQRVEHRQSSA